MDIPFSTDQFLAVFTTYNRAIYPAQIIAYLLGITAIAVAIHNGKQSGKIVLSILAFFWLWTGVVYHGIYFSQLNVAAYIFGALFILQAGLLLYTAVKTTSLHFQRSPTLSVILGVFFILYATIIYPVLNYQFGHTYPSMPVFGITPCPLTIFTFGMLLCMKPVLPVYIIAIPFLWSLIGMSAALNFNMYEDYGLAFAGILGTLLLVIRSRST